MSEKGKIVLGNDRVELVFDAASGCLESIMNKAVKSDLVAYKPCSQLFRIVYPVQGVRSHHFNTRTQKLTGHKLSEEDDKTSLILNYDKLLSNLGSFNLKVTVRAELPKESDEASFMMTISNDDEGEVTQVFFPWISGLCNVGSDPDRDAIVLPHFGGNIIRNPLKAFPSKMQELGFNEQKSVYFIEYPGEASMQWMDFFCPSHGLYMACLNREGEFLILRVKKHVWDPVEHISMAMVKYPYLQPGHFMSSNTFVLSPHLGDWHAGADKYRTWIESWMEKPKLPDWVRRSNGWFHFIVKHQDGTIINEVEEIPEIFRQAKEHGIDLLFICGWFMEGHDGRYPDYIPLDAKRLKKVFREVHEAGGRILLYANSNLYATSNPRWNVDGWKWAAKRWDGSAVLTGGNVPSPIRWEWSPNGDHCPTYEGSTFAVMCPTAEGWVSKFVEAVKNATDLGADIVLLDCLTYAHLCFDKNHGHKAPDAAWGPGLINLMKASLREGSRISPDLMLSEEGICDIFSPYMGIYHSRVGGAQYPETLNEVIRYTMPWVTGITSRYIDMDSFEDLYYAFMCGMPLDVEIHTHARGRFSDAPILAEEIKRLNKVRQENIDIIVDGVFKDTAGVSCDNPSISVKVFTSEKAALLTLWHRGNKPAKPNIRLSTTKLNVKLEKQKATLHPDGVDVRCDSDGESIYLRLPAIPPNKVAMIRIE